MSVSWVCFSSQLKALSHLLLLRFPSVAKPEPPLGKKWAVPRTEAHGLYCLFIEIYQVKMLLGYIYP